jgi:hypothetical protein
MPVFYRYTVMFLSGAYRVLQEGRKSCLPNLGVGAPYYWGKPGKGSKGRTLGKEPQMGPLGDTGRGPKKSPAGLREGEKGKEDKSKERKEIK